MRTILESVVKPRVEVMVEVSASDEVWTVTEEDCVKVYEFVVKTGGELLIVVSEPIEELWTAVEDWVTA